jgi:hypothetical protein
VSVTFPITIGRCALYQTAGAGQLSFSCILQPATNVAALVQGPVWSAFSATASGAFPGRATLDPVLEQLAGLVTLAPPPATAVPPGTPALLPRMLLPPQALASTLVLAVNAALIGYAAFAALANLGRAPFGYNPDDFALITHVNLALAQAANVKGSEYVPGRTPFPVPVGILVQQ